ncbi:MAG: CAAX amino terminal protease self- immunity [Smithella sp. PtaU1.Bin162]|nr:MAG: CAAX amino terminal protease self- immunity [Smithella sp. PtaU1.Bin162]
MLPQHNLFRNLDGEIRFFWKLVILFVLWFTIDSGLRWIFSLFLYAHGKTDFVFFTEGFLTNREGWTIEISNFIYGISPVIAVAVSVVKLDKKKLSSFCIDSGLVRPKHLFLQIIAGISVGMAAFSIQYFGPILVQSLIVLGSIYEETIQILLKPFTYPFSARPQLLLYIPTRVILPVFAEEIMFRSYIQQHMIEHKGALKGVLLATMLFMLLHVFNHDRVTAYIIYDRIFQYIVFCIVGYIYYKRRNFYMIVTMHGTMNFIIFVFFWKIN